MIPLCDYILTKTFMFLVSVRNENMSERERERGKSPPCFFLRSIMLRNIEGFYFVVSKGFFKNFTYPNCLRFFLDIRWFHYSIGTVWSPPICPTWLVSSNIHPVYFYRPSFLQLINKLFTFIILLSTRII